MALARVPGPVPEREPALVPGWEQVLVPVSAPVWGPVRVLEPAQESAPELELVSALEPERALARVPVQVQVQVL